MCHVGDTTFKNVQSPYEKHHGNWSKYINAILWYDHLENSVIFGQLVDGQLLKVQPAETEINFQITLDDPGRPKSR